MMETQEGREDEQDDGNDYCMTLKKQEKYCNLKDKALDRTVGRSRCRWDRGAVASITTYWMKEMLRLCSVAGG